MDQIARARYRTHLVIFEGVTSDEADAFLDAMIAAGEQDPDGYAEFIAEMDARVARGAEALGVSSALQRAKATVETVVAATTVPDPTTEQVMKLQAELQAKV